MSSKSIIVSGYAQRILQAANQWPMDKQAVYMKCVLESLADGKGLEESITAVEFVLITENL